uniref:Cytochrome P450 n=1 Tax=Ditylenchus dipsaci TaxID=166011 RepID=A0A915E4F0_9BILA
MLHLGLGDRLLVYLLVSILGFIFLPLKTFVLWLVLTATASLWFLQREHGYFSRLGVYTSDMIHYDRKTFLKAGAPQFGSFFMGRRELTTMDMDVLRAVCLKQFPCFTDRFFVYDCDIQKTKDNFLRNILPSLKGDEWKRVRNIITPAFTSTKLKRVIPNINKSVRKSFPLFDQHAANGDKVEIAKILDKIGIDVVGQAGFSLDMGAFEGPESPFIRNSKSVTNAFFPFLSGLIETCLKVDLMENSSHIFFRNFLSQLYDKRKSESVEEREQHNDAFQFLLDTVEVEDEFTEDSEKMANSNKKLSKLKLLTQSFLIFVAGYDTTGTVTLMALYMLALHPKLQEKLKEEIDMVVGDEEDITHEHMQKLVYLNQVIQETMRIYPIGTRINRVCTEDVTIKGMSFQKGTLSTFQLTPFTITQNFTLIQKFSIRTDLLQRKKRKETQLPT